MLHVRQDFIALHAIAPVRPTVTIALIPSDPAPAAPAATPDDDPFDATHDDDLRRELLDPTDNIPRAPHIPLPTPNAPTEPSNAPTEAANTPTEAANPPTEAANTPTEAASAPTEAANAPTEAPPTEAANPPIEPVLAQTAQTAPTGSPSIHNNGHRTAPQTATRPQTGTGSHAGTAHGTATALNEAAIWNAYARQLSAHFKRFKKYFAFCPKITDPEALELIEKLREYIGASKNNADYYNSDMIEKISQRHHQKNRKNSIKAE